MTNRNVIQHGTQTTSLGVMIGRCSADGQHGGLVRHLTNVDCSSFRYTNDGQINHPNQRTQRRKWTRENNKLALYCYFRSKPTKKVYRKRMIEIWIEFARFKATNQRFVDQFRKITKNGRLSDLKIHQQICRQTQQIPNWCGPNLGPRKDNSEHGISLKIYWSNKIQRKVEA